ncbi:hypothetical protein ACFP8W_00770 [Nocardioides hankookensis]|uniref:Swt1-like HEPN domain-containing protein n=1 Tax=Nocardioides hankookensis TaxID=443157 RepID=A0ABW1LNB4_9ACTN
MDSEWSDEILVSGANLNAYRLVYEAETWLRRIALTGLLLAHGPAWAAEIDSSLRGRLEAQSKVNATRWVLGIDAEEELLWSTTLGQLAKVLTSSTIADQISSLTGTTGAVLANRIESIGAVRNALAHNRAISSDTLDVLRGDLVVVRSAVGRFKSQTLYAQSDILSNTVPADLASFVHEFDTATRRLSAQQLFVSANEEFVMLVRLPVQPFDRWPRIAKVRELVGTTSHLLLCVLINKHGDELQFVLPRSLPNAEKLEVLERFVAVVSSFEAWTSRAPESQHPADASWPRAWYYENRRDPDR